MNWLSRLFATRRELKRLASEEKFWRERSLRLERQVEEKNNLLLEIGFRWSDRFLTSQAKTYAITDEAKANLTVNAPPKEDLQKYLQAKFDKIIADAEEEGVTREQAEAFYYKNEAGYIEEFNNDFGFSN